MKSIIQTDGMYCYRCHRAIGTETHHIFGAANRKFSDADGLTVRLCRECHDFIHFAKDGKSYMDALRELGQAKWEAAYGDREAFMKRYGRNYL